MLRIKWENITSIMIAMYLIYANTMVFIQEGFDFNMFVLELLVDVLVIYSWHYVTRNVRKSFQ